MKIQIIESGADIDPTGTYRYRLWREWAQGPTLVFCMLNPSTADAATNDATISRCITRAHRMGFGRLEVVNLFAYRSTNPAALRRVVDPVGPNNDFAILAVAAGDPMKESYGRAFICGWGSHAAQVDPGRARSVIDLLSAHGIKPLALSVNMDGSPKHPLYVGYDVTPVEMK